MPMVHYSQHCRPRSTHISAYLCRVSRPYSLMASDPGQCWQNCSIFPNSLRSSIHQQSLRLPWKPGVFTYRDDTFFISQSKQLDTNYPEKWWKAEEIQQKYVMIGGYISNCILQQFVGSRKLFLTKKVRAAELGALHFFSYMLNTSFIHKNAFFLLTFVIPKEYKINLKYNKAEQL